MVPMDRVQVFFNGKDDDGSTGVLVLRGRRSESSRPPDGSPITRSGRLRVRSGGGTTASRSGN